VTGTSGYAGTPSEEVGFQASDEYTSRISSPQPKAESIKSPLKKTFSHEDENKIDVIHVDETNDYKGFVKFGDQESAKHHGDYDDEGYPILAPDEVAKDPSPYELRPAVPPNRRGSDDARSRPSSRPASIYSPPPQEVHPVPLPDVEEYEPLFPEDEKGDQKPKAQVDKLKEFRQRFPSRDIWEDAPNSVHSTAEVSTPELADTRPRSRTTSVDLSPRETETPAQAFARRQEELAEKEALNPGSFLNPQPQQRPHSWAEHQPHLAKEVHSRPTMANRFPSRDIWEDTPDSLKFTTTVSNPQSVEDSAAEEVAKPPVAANKPPLPSRPPKKQGSGDDGTSKPIIPDRPKPQIPARPSRFSGESKESEAGAKPKPAVPARPVGGKIAALQAGFMSDLNNRLRLGPQAPKKEVPPPEPPAEEKEKAPLADARKGRARGPQRRAPTTTQSRPGTGTEKSAPPSASNNRPVLSFSMTRTLWSIDEEGTVTVDEFGQEKDQKPEATITEVKVEEPVHEEVKGEESTVKEETPVEGGEAVETKAEAPPEQKGPEEKEEEPDSKTSDDKPEESGDTVEETKTLATNTAGESILEGAVEKKEGSDEVKEVEQTKDEVIS